MKKTLYTTYKLYILILVFLIIMLVVLPIVLRVMHHPNVYPSEHSDIFKDGFLKTKNIITADETVSIQKLWDSKDYDKIKEIIHNHRALQRFITSTLGEGYILMDYIWFIEKAVVHTCHRDNNSHKFNKGAKRSYTMIVYIDDLNHCLDVIPRSNNHWFNLHLYDKTKSIPCNSGDAILFDANTVHAGSLNSNKNNRRIQLKVTHKDDISKISYYDHVSKILDKENTNSAVSKRIQKHFSCMYPILSDITQNINIDSVHNKDPSFLQKLYSTVFYSDPYYYRLKDVPKEGERFST